MNIKQMLAFAIVAVVSVPATAAANTGLLIQDLQDFSPNAGYSQGSDGHVILDCRRIPWGNGGEAVIAEWRLRAYHSSLLYVNGVVTFSVSVTPHPLNGSPVGFSVPFSRTASGSEELYLVEPLPSEFGPNDVFATIGGPVELGVEGGLILPTTAQCQKRDR